jgi:hypothetical protein
MRHFLGLAAMVVLAVARPASGAAGLAAPNLTVGRNLETYGKVRLAEAAPEGGVRIVLTSDDPKRLLLSDSLEKAGSASVTLTVRPRAFDSPEFCVQGLADHGTVTYTATAEGVGTATGTVTLAPSAIVIFGPFKAPSFPTTPRSDPFKVSIVAVALDSEMKILEEQQIAGGSTVEVSIGNSASEAGTVGASKLTLAGGTTSAATYFKPAAVGTATLTPHPPPGFSTPAELATVTATVQQPGMAVGDDLILGKDLQAPTVLCLGESPGPEGLRVTLTSSDASKLLLSTRGDRLGRASITLDIPAGQLTAPYYLQSLSDTGTVTWTATAPQFRSRTGRVELTRSGVIVAYSRYGAPDEAAVLQGTGASDDRRFYASLDDAKEHPVHVVVYSVYLHPANGLAADMTVQELRAGISVTVNLKSSHPAVGTVESPVTIPSGAVIMPSRFTPVSLGETVISVSTPAGFSTPKNATMVPAVVMK